MDEITEFLEHHGVKGQKWGIRNKKSAVKKTPRKTSSDYKKAKSLQTRHPSSLTNKQLKELNERLNLEQNYNRLNPTKKARGEAKVRAILGTVTLAVTALNSPPARALSRAGKAFILQKKRHSNKELLALRALSNSLVNK